MPSVGSATKAEVRPVHHQYLLRPHAEDNVTSGVFVGSPFDRYDTAPREAWKWANWTRSDSAIVPERHIYARERLGARRITAHSFRVPAPCLVTRHGIRCDATGQSPGAPTTQSGRIALRCLGARSKHPRGRTQRSSSFRARVLPELKDRRTDRLLFFVRR